MQQPAQLQLPCVIVVDAVCMLYIENVLKPAIDDARRPSVDGVYRRPAVDDVAWAAWGMSMSREGGLLSERGAIAAARRVNLMDY